MFKKIKRWFGCHEIDSEGNEYWYEKCKLVHRKDSKGNEEWYDDKGNRIHVKYFKGNEEWYNDKGNRTRSIDSKGNEEWYEYEAEGNRIQKRVPEEKKVRKDYFKDEDSIGIKIIGISCMIGFVFLIAFSVNFIYSESIKNPREFEKSTLEVKKFISKINLSEINEECDKTTNLGRVESLGGHLRNGSKDIKLCETVIAWDVSENRIPYDRAEPLNSDTDFFQGENKSITLFLLYPEKRGRHAVHEMDPSAFLMERRVCIVQFNNPLSKGKVEASFIVEAWKSESGSLVSAMFHSTAVAALGPIRASKVIDPKSETCENQ